MTALMIAPTPRMSGFPAAISLLPACLRRCAAAGLQLVVTAPADTRLFGAGLRRFPARQLDAAAHAGWSTAYRVFRGCGEQPHDRGSWRVLVADGDGQVFGSITARFFCGEITREHLYLSSLLAHIGPVFRDECERALADVFSTAKRDGGTPAELSEPVVLPGPHATLVAVTLARAMVALAAAFDGTVAVTATDHGHSEFFRLMRLGGAPLGRSGKFFLPPFIDQATGTRMRLLVVDMAGVRPWLRAGASADLETLRECCPIVSVR